MLMGDDIASCGLSVVAELLVACANGWSHRVITDNCAYLCLHAGVFMSIIHCIILIASSLDLILYYISN